MFAKNYLPSSFAKEGKKAVMSFMYIVGCNEREKKEIATVTLVTFSVVCVFPERGRRAVKVAN